MCTICTIYVGQSLFTFCLEIFVVVEITQYYYLIARFYAVDSTFQFYMLFTF